MSHAETFLSETAEIAGKIKPNEIAEMAEQISSVRLKGGRIFFIGLGGSAANASHAVNDFRKLCAFQCSTPTDSAAWLTAVANDEGWDLIFSQWLYDSLPTPNDILFILSVGGGTEKVSTPIKRAIDYARSQEMKILGIVGRDGGYTKQYGDCVIVIPTVNDKHITPHTEAFQSVILHCLVSHPKLQRNKTKW